MEVWLELIEAVTEGDCAEVVQLCQAYPCLTTKHDAAGNSLLHYVVVQRETQFINEFLDTVEVDKTIKNHQGATAYDLWQEYEHTVFGLSADFHEEVKILAESVMEGDLELIHEGVERGLSTRMYFFDDNSLSLVTLLHLGVLYDQPESIRAVLEHVDDALFSELLTIQDSDGQTPLELAEKKSQQGTPEAIKVLQLLRERQDAVEARRGERPDTHPPPARHSAVVLQDYCKQLIELDKKFVAGITEEDLPLVSDTLPALCALSSTVCRQALQQPHSENQALFFDQMSGGETSQLQEHLRIIAELLEACLRKGCVQSLFEFTTNPLLVKPGRIASCLPARGKIYLNPTSKKIPKTDLLTVVEVVIHETSHLAKGVLSLDFCRKERFWKTRNGQCFPRNERKIGLNCCVKLAKREKYGQPEATAERIAIAELSWRLRTESCQQPELSRVGYLAARNADTIAITALGLAAMAVGWADTATEMLVMVNENRERERKEHYLLRISPNFLSEEGIREMLEMYGATVHLAETPPPLTVFSSGTSPTKEQSLQPATTSKLAQAMASTSDTQSSSKISSNSDRSTSELLNGLLVANNRPN